MNAFPGVVRTLVLLKESRAERSQEVVHVRLPLEGRAIISRTRGAGRVRKRESERTRESRERKRVAVVFELERVEAGAG